MIICYYLSDLYVTFTNTCFRQRCKIQKYSEIEFQSFFFCLWSLRCLTSATKFTIQLVFSVLQGIIDLLYIYVKNYAIMAHLNLIWVKLRVCANFILILFSRLWYYGSKQCYKTIYLFVLVWKQTSKRLKIRTTI